MQRVQDSLTDMERCGSIVTFLDPQPLERSKIALHFYALKEAGHAMVADETISHEEKPIVRVFHYKTCTKCAKGSL